MEFVDLLNTDTIRPTDSLAFKAEFSAAYNDKQNNRKTAIALIDTRTLTAELLLEGFRSSDPHSAYRLYASTSAWMADGDNERLVLFSADPQPGRSAEQCTRDLELLKKTLPETRVIVISSEEKPDVVAATLDLGVEAYISTSMQVQAAVHVIQLVQAGGRFIPATSFETLVNQPTRDTAERSVQSSVLSAREVLVARALRKGTPNKLIAYELNMCESTVKVHVRHIMKKLKAKNRTQVAFLTNSMFTDL